jgi:hypothetical protein
MDYNIHFTSTIIGWTNKNLEFKWLTNIFNQFIKGKAR